MDGPLVDAWKEEQMHKLQEAMDDRSQETNEDLWDSFLERFKSAFTNQNQREEAYQKLCKLKQGETLIISLPNSNNLPMKWEFP